MDPIIAAMSGLAAGVVLTYAAVQAYQRSFRPDGDVDTALLDFDLSDAAPSDSIVTTAAVLRAAADAVSTTRDYREQLHTVETECALLQDKLDVKAAAFDTVARERDDLLNERAVRNAQPALNGAVVMAEVAAPTPSIVQPPKVKAKPKRAAKRPTRRASV